MRVLLVEDDEMLGEAIYTGLKQQKYVTDWVKDGKSAHSALTSIHESFDIALLDLGLPKLPGMEVLKQIRAHSISIPVLIITARDALHDRIDSLDGGADDYITKPFDLEELYARMRALVRRSQARASETIEHGNICLDLSGYTVTLDSTPITLSRREFSLLQKLLENVGRVLSKNQLNQSLYSWDEEIESNTLEVHIHNLRKRLGYSLIKTIRGIGYTIQKEPS